jgi:hypothetical protein
VLWLLLPLLSSKPSGKTVIEICIKKALAESLVIFKPKGPDCRPRMYFPAETMRQSILLLQSGTPNGGKTIHHPFYSLDLDPADFFFL